jgi:lipoprotein NlpI
MFSKVLHTFILAISISLAGVFIPAQAAIEPTAKTKPLFSQALKLLKTRQFNSAIEKFTTIIDRKTANKGQRALSWYNRGLAYQALGQLDQARGDYTRAIKMQVLKDSILKAVYYNRGLVHDGLKRPNAALADFTSAIEKSPKFSPAYHNLGNVLRKMGKNKRAIQNFLKSLELGNPQPYLTYMGLALAYEGIGRKKAAITSLKYALDLRPRFKQARDMLARLTTEELYSFAAGTEPQSDGSPVVTGSISKQAVGENLDKTTRIISDFIPLNLKLRGSFEAKREVVQYRKFALRGSLTNAFDSRVALVVPGPGLKKTQRRAQKKASPVKQPAHGSFKVQLATSNSNAKANKIWFFLKAQNKDLLQNLKPSFQRVNLGNRGFLYRLQVGPFTSRQAAKRLCQAIQERAVNCFTVERNG